MSTKRPRTELSLCKKYDIVKELNGGAKQADVAKKYGINESTVSRIKKERQSISKKFETGEKNPKQKRNRNIGFADVDQALYNWVVSTASGLPGLSGQMLLEKARKLARDLHYDDDDKIDLNWINRFKSRHMVYAAKLHGEASAVNLEGLNEWKVRMLPSILDKFPMENIFNVDETALFWKLLPNCTHMVKGQKFSGGKRSKERISVLVGASAGGEKLPLLTIGKFQQPRCFRRSSPPIQYFANKKAWMTASIFVDYIKHLEVKFKRERRRIALILDNCSAHPHEIPGLDYVTLYFLPVNTTSHLQPMDAGVIRNLKHIYRKKLVTKQLNAMDERTVMNIDLLEGLILLQRSWEEVKSDTVRNCFKHVGFVNETVTEDVENAGSECFIVEGQILPNYPSLSEQDWVEYIDADNDCATDGNDEKMPQLQTPAGDTVLTIDSDEETEENEECPVRAQDALNAVGLIRRFLANQEGSWHHMNNLMNIEDFISIQRQENMHQTTLNAYFSNI